MTWNDVVSNVRQAFRRGLGRVSGKQVQLARPGTRLEQLAEAPLDTPPIDVYENDREVLIRADVPGGNGDRATVVWDEARGLTFLVKTASLPAGTLWASTIARVIGTAPSSFPTTWTARKQRQP